MNLTDLDKIWLKVNHPKLSISSSVPEKISGILSFDMTYMPIKERIKDDYQIEIEMPLEAELKFPEVKEVGNRIPKTAERHISANGTCCLSSPLLTETLFPNGFKIEVFFQNILIPYFFGQSYFEEHKKWPWGEYDHGLMGLLESYQEIEVEMDGRGLKKVLIALSKQIEWSTCLEYLKRTSDIKGHWGCVHNTNMKFRLCHPMAFRGLFKLKRDIQRAGGLKALLTH